MVFKEDDIRPDKLMDTQKKCFMNDIKWLLQKKAFFLKVRCPACNCDDSHVIFKKYNLDYCECQNCSTVYVNPRPDENILEEYYRRSENYKYWSKYIFPASEKSRREKIFRPRVNRVVDICRSNKINTDLLIEVGAGYGIFCEEMIERCLFNKVIAIEPTPDLAEACRKKNIDVIEQPFEKAEFETANVIIAFEVLEHLFNPGKLIEKSYESLVDDGLLILTCPNISGFDLLVLGELSDTIDVEHLNYFNPESIKLLIEKFGFKLINISTPGFLDTELVRKKVLDGQLDISNNRFLKTLLIEKWASLSTPFQQFLIDNNLSSHMWIVAKK